eukprot:Nitzschia sp. Nitz4//scaffold81_size91200//34291//35118//NITZ4_004984-RA/size91200-processed-gene-0.122-mRNA-1//-1//CDS//3329558704//7313//frame0
MPPIACDGCSVDICEQFVAGSCQTCDMDFCDDCFGSGKPIEELLNEGMERAELEHATAASVTMSEMTMSITNERCSLGHTLCRVNTWRRKRYLQERDDLPAPPTIECDCCSRVITTEVIAGCCIDCDVDFCEECFLSGQSFEDLLQDPIVVENGENIAPIVAFGERYNHIRPTYKGSGRVSYDEFPDPTAFQWTFTGSCEDACIEFFEKDFGPRMGVVKLDFNYAKGKVRVVLDHRKKGVKALFTKDKRITPRLFRVILLDPMGNKKKKSKKQVV